jgi:hypothetical protein
MLCFYVYYKHGLWKTFKYWRFLNVIHHRQNHRMVENLYIQFLNTSCIIQLWSLGSVYEIMFITEECKIPEKNTTPVQVKGCHLYIHIHKFGHGYIRNYFTPLRSFQFRRTMSDGGQRQFDDFYLLRWLKGKNIILKLLLFFNYQ